MGWLIAILFFFLLWTVFNSFFMPSLPRRGTPVSTPLVSVLVPLRNEEANVNNLTAALKAVTYPNIEFILLDDQSTDQTGALLKRAIGDDARFTVLQGRQLPEGWVGKVHACHQLQQAATGDYLLFLDADIQFRPKAVTQSLALMQQKGVQLLSGFPAFEVPPLLSKLLVPMQHFVVFFHLPLVLANYTNFTAATAANGMWMMFERQAYDSFGGHRSVADSLVEDVHIARQVKAAGFKMLLANITRSVSCRMYNTNHDVWEGFLKNSYAGIGRSPIMASGLAVFYGIFYMLPLVLIFFGAAAGNLIWVIPYILTVLQQLYVMIITRQHWYLSFLIPFQAGAMIAVLFQSMVKSWKKQPYSWKGRNYS